MVKPKKHLGQHFLKDESIAQRISDALDVSHCADVLEIGPGTGVLTQFLIAKEGIQLKVIDIDTESIEYLNEHFPMLRGDIISADFLRIDISQHFDGKYSVIGNFPYNISSQIFFKVLEQRDDVPEVVCMLQKEVAERIASPPGNKTYGILSVFLQAYYDIEYLFTVDEHVFHPPPKVKSAVIRLTRNNVQLLSCSEKLFFTVVKQGFNNRRKTLRNALKSLNLSDEVRALSVMDKRAEQLSVNDFEELTNQIEKDAV